MARDDLARADPPEFNVDLTNCDREPIHLLGHVQPFGFLIAVSQDWIVQRASLNIVDFLGCDVKDVCGQPLSTIMNEQAIHTIRGRLQILSGLDAVERIFDLPFKDGGRRYDVAVHVNNGTIIIDAEPSETAHFNSAVTARSMIARLRQSGSVTSFCKEGSRQIRSLTGFDRVMVYRFDADGSGEVIAETARSGLESYLGLHYPASDIPKQARVLYERNIIRLIADIHAKPSPIVGVRSTASEPLDLSMSMLRSVSPIHIEYLGNMGVGASLSISILRRGKLWGLFACHHYGPRHISYEHRTAAELFCEVFALLLENKEREEDAAYEARAREIHSQFVADMAADPSGLEHIEDFLGSLCKILDCDGLAAIIDGRVSLYGTTPDEKQISDLTNFINKEGAGRVYAQHDIGGVYPSGRDFTENAAGLLSIPLSEMPRDYLIYFRKELARTVNWAGDPNKPVTTGPLGARLTPRKSFDLWKEEVRGQSLAWRDADIRIAESLRVTLLEIVLRLSKITDTERKKLLSRQELLIAELNHRVRNILTLIRSLVSQSKTGVTTIEQFAAVISGRIQALARAHDQITADQWGPAPLRSMIASEATAYLAANADRVKLQGPNILLEPQAFATFALVIHEMMTNSAKYGALADQRGRIEIDWSLDKNGNLELRWREIGGPPVKAPTRRGFGTTIIERSIPFELRGEADIEYALDGVRGRFVIPAQFVKRGAPDPSEMEAKPSKTKQTAQLRGVTLIVEDNLLIALDLEDILLDLGAEKVEAASNVRDALRAIDQTSPAFAILDVNLGTETSFEIASRLVEKSVPFVFATGYGDNATFPANFESVPIVKKPYAADDLADALRKVGVIKA